MWTISQPRYSSNQIRTTHLLIGTLLATIIMLKRCHCPNWLSLNKFQRLIDLKCQWVKSMYQYKAEKYCWRNNNRSRNWTWRNCKQSRLIFMATKRMEKARRRLLNMAVQSRLKMNCRPIIPTWISNRRRWTILRIGNCLSNLWRWGSYIWRTQNKNKWLNQVKNIIKEVIPRMTCRETCLTWTLSDLHRMTRKSSRASFNKQMPKTMTFH